jgi:xanthine dehydrogenase/oxidase
MLICEAWVDHMARVLKLPAEVVRARNLYKEGQLTHFGQPLLVCRIERMWNELKASVFFG